MPAPILDLDLPPDHPIRQILATIEAHPEVREPVLRALLTEDFLALPGQVQGVSDRVDGLTERVDGLTERVDKLREDFDGFREETREQFRSVNERLDENTRRLDENTRRLDENTRRLDENTRRLDVNTRVLNENTESTKRLEGHVGRLRGLSYEDACRYYIGVILDGFLDGPVLADRELINSQLLKARRNDLISRPEYEHGLSPDIIARAQDDVSHSERLAVVEASVTFNRRDLENAAARAAIIGRVTGVRADAFLATHYPWPDDIGAVAQQLGVTIIRQESEEHAYDY